MRLRMIAVVSVAVASVCWTAGMTAQQQTPPSEQPTLMGVWELVSLQDHRPNGEVLDWMGKSPSGTLIYSPDGHMSVQIMRDPHPVAGSIWSSDGRTCCPVHQPTRFGTRIAVTTPTLARGKSTSVRRR